MITCDKCGATGYIGYRRFIKNKYITVCDHCEDYIREGEDYEFFIKTIQSIDCRCSPSVRPEGKQQQLLLTRFC